MPTAYWKPHPLGWGAINSHPQIIRGQEVEIPGCSNVVISLMKNSGRKARVVSKGGT